jgi:DNA-binding LacI/PurR family transcriptional regulator
MERFQVLTAPEQVAAHLREELAHGRWRRVMPGEDRLIAQLGIGRHTVKAALKLLEDEGLLENQGPGRQRRICPSESVVRRLRIRVLLYETRDRALPYQFELMARLQEAGFAADFAPKSLNALGMEPGRVARFVGKHPADAWIVQTGSREILEWFARHPVPCFALFGRFSGLPLAAASPRKTPAMAAAVRRLVGLGHHRVVMLTREERRTPRPALYEQNFLDELARHGVATGPYNLPDWDESPGGLRSYLESAFRFTPPTALMLADPEFTHAVQQFLARRGLAVPEHVSLVCDDPDPGFAWCDPPMAHIRWDFMPLVRRVVRWADHVARGKEDKLQKLFDAELVEGGTIGPVPKGRPPG